MNRKITGYCKDLEDHWVATLECGHSQHVRHEPPFFPRLWVTSKEGRDSRLGTDLNCPRCDEFAAELLDECAKVMREAYESAGLSGVCAEGRWDLALDALRALRARRSGKSN